MRTILLSILVVGISLAGCTGTTPAPTTTPASSTHASSTPVSSTPATSTPASSTPASSTPVASTPATSTPVSSTPPASGGLGLDSFNVTTPGVPSMVAMGKPFNVAVHVSGGTTFSSDNISVQYATSPRPNPTMATTTMCDHLSGNVPGDYTVACNVSASGMIYLRGHVRVTEANVTHEYWGPEQSISVVNATVTVAAPTSPAQIAGQPWSFQLTVTGDAGTASNITARYSNRSNSVPSDSYYPSSCQPTSGATPGTFTITCTVAQADTYFVRGKVVFGDPATSQAVFWSDDMKVVVSGTGLPGIH